MNFNGNKGGEEVRAPDTPSHTSSEADGWKDFLQLLKEQSKKMERLARALSVIQQGMLRNNPGRKDARWKCGGASHVAKECKAPPQCLTCTDRGEKDVAHASWGGSCPIFRAELRRLRGGKWNFYSSTSGEGRKPRTF